MSLYNYSTLIGAGFLDVDGYPLTGGKLFHYLAGTTTDKNMYRDTAGNTLAPQPTILDGAGVAKLYGSGLYKFVVKDKDDNTIYTLDNQDLAGNAISLTATKLTIASDGQAIFTVPAYLVGTTKLHVYFDGIRLSVAAGDYTETSTTQITLAASLAATVTITGTSILVEVF